MQLNLQNPINWQSPLNRGLVGWWLNLPNGAWRGGNTFRNLLGRNHGAFTNSPLWSGAKGRPGGFGSLEFNGSNTLVIASAPSTTRCTVAAWINLRSLGIFRRAVGIEGSGTLRHILAQSASVNGRPRFVVALSGGSTATAEASSALNTNVWYRWVGTFDGSTVRLYINGVQVGSAAASGDLITTDSLVIGGDSTISANEVTDGWIDDVRYSSRAWSAAEVAYDYQSSRQGNPNELNWERPTRYFLPLEDVTPTTNRRRRLLICGRAA